jgi:MinD-like ATPase involved in chromosome partitioning or flagellar assembly
VSVIALASAKGSPGVTTLAHRLADVLARQARRDAATARPVVIVEADPAGGDLAARRGLAGAPGLASLALSARRSLDPSGVLAHCQPLGPVHVLAGVAGSRQGSVVAPVVPRLLAALREIDALVVLDAGRLGAPASDGDLPVALADVVLLVTRTGAECVVHARSAVDSLRGAAVRAELVLVGRPEFPARSIEEAVGAPVLGIVADAPAEAAADPASLLRGRRGELARSVEALAGALAGRLAAATTSGKAALLPLAGEASVVPLRAVRQQAVTAHEAPA